MIQLIYTHPAFILIFFSLMLYLAKLARQDALFLILSVIACLISAFKIIYLQNLQLVELFNFKLVPVIINAYNKPVVFALILALTCGSLYGMVYRQFTEIIIANIYCAAATLTLFAGDFVLLVIGIELMLLASTAMIAIGNYSDSKASALRYFIMHVVAGSLIIAGIVALNHDNNLRSITLLTSNLNSSLINKEFIGALLILIGLLINIGAPPFSSWISDSYPLASTVGTIFLTSFTTKVNIYILMVLFAGYKYLIYIGVVMSVYGIIYSILENNLRRISCFMTISQLGLMLMAIGLGSRVSMSAALLLCMFHIIYKLLFNIVIGCFIETTKLELASEIMYLKTQFNLSPLILGGFMSILYITSFPYTGAFLSKVSLSSELSPYIPGIYAIYTSFSSIAILAIPWNELVTLRFGRNISLPTTIKALIMGLSLLLFISGIFSDYLMNFISHNNEVLQFNIESVKSQLLHSLALVFIIKFLGFRRYKFDTILLNFDYFYRRSWIPDIYASFESYLETILSGLSNISDSILNSIRAYNYKLNMSNLVLLSIGFIITIALVAFS